MTSAAPHDDRSPAIGRILSRAFDTIGANPLTVFGIAFLLAAVPEAMIAIGAAALSGAREAGSYEFLSETMSGWFASLVLSAIAQGALARVTVAQAEGGRASIGQGLLAGLRALLPLFLLGMLMTIGLAIGFVLLFVPGIILWLTWSVAAPALVEERRGVFNAFARSRALTRGARWRILALELVVLVFYTLIVAVLGIASIFFSHVLNDASRLIVWSTAWAVVSKTLTAGIWGTIQTSLYIELRDWKDGPPSQRLADIFA